MATKKAGGLSWDSKKRTYVRSLGWIEKEGKFIQPKFYLGSKLDEAKTRNQRLEQLWRSVVELYEEAVAISKEAGHELPDKPHWKKAIWQDDLLEAARAVAHGETSHTVRRRDKDASNYLVRIRLLNRYHPAVLFRAEDEVAVAQELNTETKHLQFEALWKQQLAACLHVAAPEDASGPRLNDALDAYVAELEKEAHLSEWSRVRVNQARRLRERHEDLPLSALDIKKVEEMVAFWKNRPPVKLRGGGAGGPMAYNTCRNQLIQLRHFFKWLHRHPDYPWQRPDGYDDIDGTPRVIAADQAAKRRTLHVETYSVEELAVLYASASPLMRLFILLGLNCGFIAAETGTLVPEEIFLDQRHPETGQYGITSTDQDNWIRRVRLKNGVYGEWRLWPHTVAGLRWAMRRRKEIESSEAGLVVTAKGASYCRSTRGGNKNSRVRNLWVSFIKKVQASHQGFRFLAFKQLRKTGGQLVRRFADGETQGVFLCHGKPVKTDDLADIYSNRPFFKVFEALNKIEKHLAPLWQACPDPFGGDAD